MQSIWVNGTDDQLAAGVATYDLPIFGVRSIRTPIGLNWFLTLMPDDVNLDVMRVSLENAPGVGESRTFTLYGGGAPTAQTVTIAGANTTGEDLANSIGFAPGVDGYLHCTATAGAAASRLRYSFLCRTFVEGQSVLACTGDTGGMNTTLTRYMSLGGAQLFSGIPAGAGGSVMLAIPADGTIDKLYVEISVAPGEVSGANQAKWELTVWDQDGATTLTCTIAGAVAKTANDTTHSFTVAAGDIIYLEIVPVASTGRGGAPPNTARLSASVAFTADNGKSFIIPNHSDQMNPTGGTKYRQAGTGIGVWDGTEANVPVLAQAMKITRKQVLLDGAPGIVDDTRGYGFDLIRNGVLTASGCSVRGFSTSCSDTDNVIVADDDLLSQRMIPITVPAAPTPRHAAISYAVQMLPSITNQGAAASSLF